MKHQAAGDRFHSDRVLQAEPCFVEQHQTDQEVQQRIPVVGIARMPLAGLGWQQVLDRAGDLLNPTALAPFRLDLQSRQLVAAGLARLLEHAVVTHPRLLAPTQCSRALVPHLRLPENHKVLAPTPQLAGPLRLGQRPQDTAREIFIPALILRQLIGLPACKTGGEHHPKDFAQQLHLGLQPPLDLGRQSLRQLQIVQRLFQGLQESLRTLWLLLESLAVPLEVTLCGIVLASLGSGHHWHRLLR